MKFRALDPTTAFEEAVNALATENKVIVCGSPEDQTYIQEALESSDKSTDEIINASNTIDVQAWFKQRRKELETEFERELSESEGEWPAEPEAKAGFTLIFDMLTGEAHTDLIGASINTDEAWKIPAHFKYGGWNDCPDAELHCAIWKYWQQKYGAQIVGLSNDVIEAYVTNPPKTKEQAMELAWEQYLYCYDVVDQGVETISNLAASIIDHQVWYFWWD